MSLKFKSGSDSSRISRTDVTLGHRDGWDLSRFKGDYKSGKNFFSVHYEVDSKKPNIIRFHVESPKFDIDEKLNTIKNNLIEDIKNNIKEITSSLKKGEIKDSVGTYNLINIKNDKCSEVFQIILDEKLEYSKAKENIKIVDNDLGKFLDTLIKKYSDNLKKLNLENTI